MKAAYMLAANISGLLRERNISQHDLALWCRHSDVWLSNFLKAKREIQLKDLDRIADFFGLATYQLFQPGVTKMTERRSGVERRAHPERRISHQQRNLKALAAEMRQFRPKRGRSVALDTK